MSTIVNLHQMVWVEFNDVKIKASVQQKAYKNMGSFFEPMTYEPSGKPEIEILEAIDAYTKINVDLSTWTKEQNDALNALIEKTADDEFAFYEENDADVDDIED